LHVRENGLEGDTRRVSMKKASKNYAGSTQRSEHHAASKVYIFACECCRHGGLRVRFAFLITQGCEMTGRS